MSRILIISLLTVLFISLLSADEGMYPLSEIQKLNLRSKGLKVSSTDIFNPGKIGLIDAIVQVGGCTGSFVSEEGLIITNHHCAFGIVQAASTSANDYITDGFLAANRSEELQAKGYTVRITESYKDVSNIVLSAVSDTMDLAGRTKAIDKKMKEIVAETEKANPGKRAEVSEMFAGKSYTLFVYTFIKDVRAVYIPPRSIGEFGGENDNWVWPRHTGDFSFLRAYVAPDGSPAEYSEKNVPYHPKKYLRVNPNGVDENDAVFILGYPGRTFRHRTSHYLSYEEDIRMPYIADLNDWLITTMEGMGKDNKDVAIKHAGRIKSLANVMKNFRGKLKGLRRIQHVSKKREEEQMLQQFIDSDPKRKEQYGTVLQEIGKVYDEMRLTAQMELTLDNLRQAPLMVSLGYSLFEATSELQKPDLERESPYMDRNFSRTKETYKQSLKNLDVQTDKVFLKEMLTRASRLPAGSRIAVLDSMFQGNMNESAINMFVEASYSRAEIDDEKKFIEALAMTPEQVAALNDPFVSLAKTLYPAYQQLKETRQRRDGSLSKLSAKLVDVKQLFMKKDFIPDANSTLRLTFGQIKGYSPADALYASPITTLRGVIDKTTGVEPYISPSKLLEQYKAKNLGKFKHKKLNDVPVALLYNLDTTGGNSGSPLLNASGELVGVNFDRAFEATINDYAWNADYSRSIAVDIRYVLWVTENVAGAGYLLKEMGIPPSR